MLVNPAIDAVVAQAFAEVPDAVLMLRRVVAVADEHSHGSSSHPMIIPFLEVRYVALTARRSINRREDSPQRPQSSHRKAEVFFSVVSVRSVVDLKADG